MAKYAAFIRKNIALIINLSAVFLFRSLNKNFKLIFSRQDFRDSSETQAHFDEHWESDNPKVFRKLSRTNLKSVRELYLSGGAHYTGGSWQIFSEITDYRNLEGTPNESGAADNVITECPVCHESCLVRKNWMLDSYVHISGVRDGRTIDIIVHARPHKSDGLIDAGTI